MRSSSFADKSSLDRNVSTTAPGTWKNAKEYTIEEVDPKQPYFDNDFEGAKFIWTDDIALDNTVIFRTKVEKPGWTPRWNTKPDLDVSGLPAR